MVEDDVFQGDGREGELLLPQNDLTEPHEGQDHGHLHALNAHGLPHTLTPVSACPAHTAQSHGHPRARVCRFPAIAAPMKGDFADVIDNIIIGIFHYKI